LSLNDDGEFFSRIVLAASAIAFCAGARGYYRTDRGNSLSGRRDGAALRSAFAAIELSCGHLLRRCGSEEARKACATQYRRFAYEVYPDVPDLVRLAERRAVALGDIELKPGGGRKFQLLARSMGWRVARRCQLAWRHLRRRSVVVTR
jgi:hypothetical protein